MSRDVERAEQYRRETENFLRESLAPAPRRFDILPFIVGFVLGVALGLLGLLAAWLSN